MSAKRSGGIFTLGDCDRSALPSFVTLLMDYPKQREMVEAIFDLCAEDPEGMTDMPTLMERLGIKRPTVLQRVERLKEFNLIDIQAQQVYSGMRSVNVYYLRWPSATSLSQLSSSSDSDAQSTGAISMAPNSEAAQQAAFEFMGERLPDIAILDYYPDVHEHIAWKAERFTVLTLLAGLRVGRTGQELRIKRTRIFLGHAWMDLEVRAAEGKVTPSIIDLRVLIVVCTLVREHLFHATEQGKPEHGYLLKMSSICKAMEMDAAGGNKRYLFEQLSRWKSSEFEIKQSMYGALHESPWLHAINRAFNVLIDLTVAEVVGTDGVTPEVIRVILHPALIEALRHRHQTLSIHPEILRERKPQPFMHLVYYWCRRVIKHSAEPRIIRLEHLRREIRPQITLNKFRAEVRGLLKTYRVVAHDQLSHSMIPGYILRLGANDELSIHADPRDKIVGENSPKALADQKRGGRTVEDLVQNMLPRVTSRGLTKL